ncbi:MAG: type 4a pilus biogenesis protein PilO [Candidatus Eisenbacteria bacterium]|uniref:Type 4a pilus biogenesis protein PilO n=1 Tax=Eiseniibacteriota bacterium TaxID=2212470 RepID=A0A849STR8_UNCEI|nr:type 4a pilus biogenesis protein PilO [Candidatus Eisenbacteria bacterium]
MNTLLLQQLRRHWQIVAAATLLLAFLATHFMIFHPARTRLEHATTRAQSMRVTLDPDRQPVLVPPRVVALFAENSLTTARAVELGNSGELTADLLSEASEIANRCGMDVLTTEPGAAAQQGEAVQVRARLTARADYSDLVRFMDAISRSPRLIAVDHFVLKGSGRSVCELSIVRYVLKRSGSRS